MVLQPYNTRAVVLAGKIRPNSYYFSPGLVTDWQFGPTELIVHRKIFGVPKAQRESLRSAKSATICVICGNSLAYPVVRGRWPTGLCASSPPCRRQCPCSWKKDFLEPPHTLFLSMEPARRHFRIHTHRPCFPLCPSCASWFKI